MLRPVSVIFVLLFGRAAGQELLRLDEAIGLALQKNYDVLAVRNETEIARLQNNLGAAGMSPTLSLNGNYNTARLNSYQVFNNGTVQDRAAAQTNGTGVSLNLDWVIFDGLRMFAVRKRLRMSEEASGIRLRQQMENTVYDIIVSYHNIARVNSLIKAARQNLALYTERRKIAEVRLEIGSDSKVELLLSRSDENRAKSGILLLERELLDTKVQLNTLLGRTVSTEFVTEDTIVVNYNPQLEELRRSSSTANSSLLLARKNEEIVRQGVDEARALVLPFVTVSGSYLLNRSESQAGFVAVNRQTGLNAGLTARWTIFNGGRNYRLIKERNVLALSQRYFTEQTQLQVDGLVYVNYQSFLLNRQIVEMELQNLNDSREVQLISLERYRTGKAGVLETIVAQNNLEEAQVRFINALYNAKMAEAELLRVNGQLVK